MPDQDQNTLVTVRKTGRCGLITLNRPDALNALSRDIIDTMEEFYKSCLHDPHIYGMVVCSTSPKAFCAGADVRSLVKMLPEQAEIVRQSFIAEFQHNWTLEQFNKPNISLIDGVVMGGGAGISIYGTHVVMGRNTRFAMPEVSIGFFPDVGATWRLARLKGGMGLYLALTGRTISAADCLYLDIATHTIPVERFEDIKLAMAEAAPIDEVLGDMQEDFGPSELEGLQDVVDRVFTGETLEQVFSNLDREADDGWSDHSDWARDTEDLLRKKCPLSQKIAFRQIQKAGSARNLKEVLVNDIRIMSRLIVDPNFIEGVNAVLISKTGDAVWTPGSIEEVREEDVDAFFAPLENEPVLSDLDF